MLAVRRSVSGNNGSCGIAGLTETFGERTVGVGKGWRVLGIRACVGILRWSLVARSYCGFILKGFRWLVVWTKEVYMIEEESHRVSKLGEYEGFLRGLGDKEVDGDGKTFYIYEYYNSTLAQYIDDCNEAVRETVVKLSMRKLLNIVNGLHQHENSRGYDELDLYDCSRDSGNIMVLSDPDHLNLSSSLLELLIKTSQPLKPTMSNTCLGYLRGIKQQRCLRTRHSTLS